MEALASAGTEKSHSKDNFTQVSCTINMKFDAGRINEAQGVKKRIHSVDWPLRENHGEIVQVLIENKENIEE